MVPTVGTGSVQSRYVACGVAVLVSACLGAPRLNLVGGSVLAGVLIAAGSLGFAATPYRLSGPSWAAQAAEIESGCPTRVPEVELSPAGWGTIRLPC